MKKEPPFYCASIVLYRPAFVAIFCRLNLSLLSERAVREKRHSCRVFTKHTNMSRKVKVPEPNDLWAKKKKKKKERERGRERCLLTRTESEREETKEPARARDQETDQQNVLVARKSGRAPSESWPCTPATKTSSPSTHYCLLVEVIYTPSKAAVERFPIAF